MLPHIGNGRTHDKEIAVIYPAVLSTNFIDAVKYDAIRGYYPQAVEVVKNGIDRSRLLAKKSNIPGRKSAMRLRQNVNVAAEDRGPSIEIFLVSEFVIFQKCVTPFDTSVLPPMKNA